MVVVAAAVDSLKALAAAAVVSMNDSLTPDTALVTNSVTCLLRYNTNL
jgi:hypothetical protein